MFAAPETEVRRLDGDAARVAEVVLADGTVTLGVTRWKAAPLLGFCLLVTAVFVTGVIAGSTVATGTARGRRTRPRA